MSLRSRGALAGALAGALLVPLSALDTAAGEQGQQQARGSQGGPSMLALDARGSTRAAPAQRATISSGFVGSDGLFYDWAPLVVGGFADDLFLGQDFDAACADGHRFTKAMKRLAKLARLIESAGKRVVFTVAPNKSSVNGANVDWANVPHGTCGQLGVAGQNSTLDSFKDARYLPIRKSLADDPREVYWKTDAHWTTVGSAVYASELADKLSKKLGRRQKYAPTIRTELGDIFQLLGLTTPETAPALVPDDGVTVTTAPGSDGFDPVNAVTFQHSWRSTPARRTLGGHTLVIGDSFTYLGLEALRPLFAKGTFMWIQPPMLGRMAAGIAGADTVVIEVVQRFVSTSILATTTFRAAVKEQLKRS